MELWDIRLDPEVKAQTGGSSRNGPVHTVPRPFSGSGVLLRYYFKPLKVGVSNFGLYDVELKDASGIVLPSSVSSCLVTVTSFSEWVDGEYKVLSSDFNGLSEEYDELNHSFSTLQEIYTSLDSDFSELSVQIGELESLVDEATDEVTRLEVENNELSQTVDELQNSGISILFGVILVFLFMTMRASQVRTY